jgi:hypothetical protein
MQRRTGTYISLLLMVMVLILNGCSGSSDTPAPLSGTTGTPGLSETPGLSGTPGIGDTIGAYAHHNMLYFDTYAVSSVSFSETGHSITGGQPWNGVSCSYSSGVVTIDVNCGRKDSSGPSNWFLNYVGNGRYCSARDSVGELTPMPGDANFAVSGVLTIDGNSYNVCFAQAGMSGSNLWFVGGPQFTVFGMDAIPIYTQDSHYDIGPQINNQNDYTFQLNNVGGAGLSPFQGNGRTHPVNE